jgi:apolipoprotein N-acyltransferase
VTVAAVQGDVPGKGDDILYDYRQVTQNHVDATVDLARQVAAGEKPRPDFVLWPENSTAVDPFEDAETNSGIRTASSAIGVPILVGAIVDAGPDQVLNQGIVWDPETGAGDRYTKRHPVPFGEYIPGRAIFTHYSFFDRLRDVGRDMLSGTRREPLDIAGVQVADAICFDVAYDDGIQAQLRNGAELLVVQSSNATFIHTDQIDQQFAITRLRAMETGRWVAVATTNGVSGIIAPDGHVVATAEPRTKTVLVERLGLSSALTPAMRIGPWSGRVAVALTVLGLVLVLLPYRRRRQLDADRGNTATDLPQPTNQQMTQPMPVGGQDP